MSVTDPISNMLTKIRNASASGKGNVDVKASRLNEGILDILKKEKFIQNFKTMKDEKQNNIRIYLKSNEDGTPAIQGLKRVSKPGYRIYVKSKDIKKVVGGLGIAIISTPQGLMTDSEAKEKRLGGEVLCWAW